MCPRICSNTKFISGWFLFFGSLICRSILFSSSILLVVRWTGDLRLKITDARKQKPWSLNTQTQIWFSKHFDVIITMVYLVPCPLFTNAITLRHIDDPIRSDAEQKSKHLLSEAADRFSMSKPDFWVKIWEFACMLVAGWLTGWRLQYSIPI